MLNLGTMIPTPTGWKTMGELVAGDEIFDENGQICRVIIAHPVDPSPVSYHLTFDDGSVIDACADHKWLTFDAREMADLTKLDPEWRARRQAARPSRAGSVKSEAFRASIIARNKTREYAYKELPKGSVRTTAEIAASLHTDRGRTNHAVPVARPLELPKIELPLDPYCLGAWLGDGSARNAQFTGVDPEIWQNFERAGFSMVHYCDKQHNVLGLQKILRAMDLLANKHVPANYLRASKEQRLALLQGLMDTDGTVVKGGGVEFTNTNERIVKAALELIVSLGWKAKITEGRAKFKGKDCGPVYDIKWTPSEYVFRLARKRGAQRLATRRTTKFRYIVGCESIEPVPMRCITVDSPSHLYLAGETMIPTHNTDLLLGLAGTAHYNSIIFRRVFPSMRGIIERSREVYNCRGDAHAKDSYNESLHMWRMADGRIVEMGSMQYHDDRENYRGRPHDLYAWDEVTEFSQSQFTFVNAWNRSARPGVRCRVVATCNPPTTAEGQWVVKYWGPWLDDKHPNPARVGEVRWFVMDKGKSIEVPDGNPFMLNGEIAYPKSRTFIAATLADNPYLEKTGYRATLQGLPEPLRSQMLYGDFKAGMKDSAWQVIPTAWVDAAIARGKAQTAPDVPLTCLGVDPSRGGDDFAIAPRYGNWFAPIETHTRETIGGEIDGPIGAKLVTDAHRPGAEINLDGIGIGTSVYDQLKDMAGLVVNTINVAMPAKGFDGLNEVPMMDKTGRFKLTNIRTATLWKLREALDPESGENLCFPDDDELRADLTAPTYKVTSAGYVVEPKHGPGSISERLGRSPGKGDALALAFWQVPQPPKPMQAWFAD